MDKEIKFFLQGNEHTVKIDKVTPETMLNEYLRDYLKLTGTKKMCYEGGCGSCLVAVKKPDPLTSGFKLVAVNSCLVSILSCDGWHIETIEGIGNPETKFHILQETLAKFNGTQCGFCSPGMVMNMYALYETKKENLKMQEVEDAFSGNICRCTGYRPILTGFKSLCKDVSTDLIGTLPDIEDSGTIKCNLQNASWKNCSNCPKIKPFVLTYEKAKWIQVLTLDNLLEELKNVESPYMLVGGNTAKGVYKPKIPPKTYIDIAEVKELWGYEITDENLVVGASNSLNDIIELFRSTAKSNGHFEYLEQLAKHIELVANTPVRNIATVAGNLMTKHKHNDFPSDIFLIFVTVGAQLTICNTDGSQVLKKVDEFLHFDMNHKVIINVILPTLSDSYFYKSYKILPRAQNVHALVNAGFLFKMDKKIVKEATVVYGNINPSFVHAKNTEIYLIEANLFQNSTLQNVFEILDQELKPNYVVTEASPKYRRQLAVSLFYKAVLSLATDEDVPPSMRSGRTLLERPISHGTQDFETHESLYPLTQAIPKIEALAQTSGQAEYIDDMPDMPHQLYAQFVIAKAPVSSVIEKIDASAALALKEIVAFYTKDDIPGENTFIFFPVIFPFKEEIFCEGYVKFWGQPIGVLVSEKKSVLYEAVDLVKVTYRPPTDPPLTSTKDILKAKETDRVPLEKIISPTRRGKNVQHIIKGTFNLGLQYHFHMETQCCNAIPTEDGLEINSATQWMDYTQSIVCRMLKVPNHRINVKVRRLGGAFGAKITRANQIACACALPAWILKRPVRISLSLEDNMIIVGKRFPFYADYEIGVDNNGTIQYLDISMYSDVGTSCGNDDSIYWIISAFSNYITDTYHVKFHYSKTDTPGNTYARAPGTCEGVACIEAIMDHIAHAINVDPLNVRLANLPPDSLSNQIYRMTIGEDDKYAKMKLNVREIKEFADVEKRKNEIDNFNQENRWKKKGLSIVPMGFELGVYLNFIAKVCIHHGDGSVSVLHSGVEMGQGVNTKAAQVCAFKFGIPLNKVQIYPSSSNVSPNSTGSNGSGTTQGIAYSIKAACDLLLKRMKPYKLPNMSWEQWVTACHNNNVRLSDQGIYSLSSPNVHAYKIYGVGATEVLVDILTGQYIVTRVDIVQDTGRSMNPLIDIGQTEGAFIMGLGYYTTENIILDDKGKTVTNNTWTYWPPGAKDIPVDFRVKFQKHEHYDDGVLFAKPCSESPLALSISVPLAIRYAVASARADSDRSKPRWFEFDGPTSVENTFLNCLNNYKQYNLS